MPTWLWITLAAIAASALAVWAYGYREEPVRGRSGPGLLRGLATFFLLAGLWLPALRPPAFETRGALVLLDVSASMGLPSRPGGSSRMDSARALLAGFPSGRTVAFGDRPAFLQEEALPTPSAARSLLMPAIEAAGLAGFDSVVVVSDGGWDDPVAALELAAGMGLGVREQRVASPARRVGLRDAVAPERVSAGDTVRISFEIVTGGVGDPVPDGADVPGGAVAPPGAGVPGSDSVRVLLRGSDVELEVDVRLPDAGRSSRGEIRWPAAAVSAGVASEWRTYELSLADGADPYGAADRISLLVEVTSEAADAVLVSEAPDWGPSFLLPLLDRVTSGGAHAYVRVGADRYLRLGTEPIPVEAAAVRRSVLAARLLAVQGSPGDLPAWLSAALRRHPRKLVFSTGPGDVPGVTATPETLLDGEWYPEQPAASAPTSALLSGLQLAELPPIHDVLLLGGSWEWASLMSRRDRRGEARPLAVAGRGGGARWALVVGSGYWRWGFRGGEARRVYEGLFGGIAGWLLEGVQRRAVDLAEVPTSAAPARWRVGPGITDLAITVYDSAGRTVWAERWEEPEALVMGPSLPAGPASFEAVGEGPEGRLRIERPMVVRVGGAELEPKPLRPEIALPASGGGVEGEPPRRSRAVWPFALAIVLFGGEWIWRRRIGLR
jgi:hypothetical protein